MLTTSNPPCAGELILFAVLVVLLFTSIGAGRLKRKEGNES